MANDKLPAVTQMVNANSWKPNNLSEESVIVTPYREPVPVGKASEIKAERDKQAKMAEQARIEAEEARQGQFEALQDKAYKEIGYEALTYIRDLKGQRYLPSDIKIGKNTITVKNYALDKEGKRTNKIIGQSVTKYNSKGEIESVVSTEGNKRYTRDYKSKDYMKANSGYGWSDYAQKYAHLDTEEQKINGRWVVKEKYIRVPGSSATMLIYNGKPTRKK